MKKKMGIEGVGPKIVVRSLVFLVLAYILDRLFHNSFIILSNIETSSKIGGILLILGVVLWIWSAVLMLINFPKGKLITTGPFALFLNPLYSAFSFFMFPALAFYLNSWIYFGGSIILFIFTVTMGKAEERFLQDTFGKEYEEYKKKVIFKF